MNDGGLAFPFACQGPTTGPEFYYGMTLRDYFAAKALQGLLSDSIWMKSLSHNFPEQDITEKTATAAYNFADAMLRARDKV